MAQQGSGPPQTGAAEDEDLPEWAIPSPVRPPRRHATPSRREQETPKRRLRGRAKLARARRNKRRLVALSGLVAVAVLIAVLAIVLSGSKPASNGLDGLVTTYQRGELRSVPSVCETVSAGTLSQYLPGKLDMVSLPGLSGKSSNQCDWTLDHKPVYRLLEVTATAYAPSGLASGNGSATAAATDTYAQTLQGYQHPPKSAHQPQAQINTVPGLGMTAFSAFQVISVGAGTSAEATTYRVTVLARYRNVLVTAEFSGLEHASQGGYGPVSARVLQDGAVAAARDLLQKV